MAFGLTAIKRGLLFFWALWFTVVLASNVTDGLKALNFLSESWPFASGNYLLLAKVTAIYRTPRWIAALLFFGIIVWQAWATLLFWAAFRSFRRIGDFGVNTVDKAFAASLALWAAFIIADEILIVYESTPLEAVHLSILAAQIITLLAVRLLPDNGRANATSKTE